MKIIQQIGIIFGICWVSQVIESLLPISFPASVISMILVFLFLCTGLLKVDHIREKSDFLLSNMAFFFIPAGVNIINYLDILKSNAIPLIIICVVSTAVTFAATASSIRLTIYRLNRRKGK